MIKKDLYKVNIRLIYFTNNFRLFYNLIIFNTKLKMSLNINQASTAAGFIDADVAVPIRGAELFVAGMVNNLLGANELP